MTTIAYRNFVIAADTGATQGSTLVAFTNKVARRDDGTLAGCAGAAAYGTAFFAWFLAREEGKHPRGRVDANGDCLDRAFIVRIDGRIELYEGDGVSVLHPKTEYFAVGSGAEIALGAMHAGASAREAVRAAITHDVYTGGWVEALSREGE